MDRAPEMAKRLALPTVDIEVVFDFNSSEITAKAAEQLRTLGQAMADPRLADARFVIAGHTDARGRPAYNLTLSQARAEAVRWHIVQTYGIKAENLFARGFGQRQLKNRANPRADENRRVQIINFTGVAADGRRRR